MSVTAYLKFEDGSSKSYPLTCARCTVSRESDGISPDTTPRRKDFHISLNVTDTDHLIYYEWYIAKSMKKGVITIYYGSETTRELEFENALCCGFKEHYYIDSKLGRQRQLDVDFSAGSVTVEGESIPPKK